MHICIDTYIYIHTETNTYTHIHMHACMHRWVCQAISFLLSCSRHIKASRIFTDIHNYTHTHTHTHIKVDRSKQRSTHREASSIFPQHHGGTWGAGVGRGHRHWMARVWNCRISVHGFVNAGAHGSFVYAFFCWCVCAWVWESLVS